MLGGLYERIGPALSRDSIKVKNPDSTAVASRRPGPSSKWRECFIAQDSMGQNVAWYYFRDDPTITLAAAVLLKQQGRREGSLPRWGKRARLPASPRSRYFCWLLFVCAAFECSSADCDCCLAWVECSLPLAWSFLPWESAAERWDFAADS
jgi:hypothetical protein